MAGLTKFQEKQALKRRISRRKNKRTGKVQKSIDSLLNKSDEFFLAQNTFQIVLFPESQSVETPYWGYNGEKFTYYDNHINKKGKPEPEIDSSRQKASMPPKSAKLKNASDNDDDTSSPSKMCARKNSNETGLRETKLRTSRDKDKPNNIAERASTLSSLPGTIKHRKYKRGKNLNPSCR